MSDKAEWLEHFEGLGQLPEEVAAHLSARASMIELPAGVRVFGPGQAPSGYLLLVDGTVRVQQVAENGREIVLYRVSAGESCALTTACLMSHEDYRAEAITETPVRAISVPGRTFDDLIARSPEFRRFVFTAFSHRMTSLLLTIEEVAFQRLDIRLAQKLLERASTDGTLEATHQQLAAELGSAREVIGRLLGDFQRRGWLTTSRGHIEVLDRAALQRLTTAA